MSRKQLGSDDNQRRSNRRLALALGLVALAFYLFIVVFKPLGGS